MKFSKRLEAELEYLESCWEGDPESMFATRKDRIRYVLELMDHKEHWAKDFRTELQNFGIEIGMYKPYTKAELDMIYVNRGKKYDFKRGDLFYRFESWEPFEKLILTD